MIAKLLVLIQTFLPPLLAPRLDMEAPPPVKAEKPFKDIYEEYAAEKPTLYIIYDDEKNSSLLLTSLKLDWYKHNAELQGIREKIRVNRIVLVKWDDRESIKKHRLNYISEECPRYRVGNVGSTQLFPKRSFNTNFWPLLSTKILVDEYFYEKDLETYEEYLGDYQYDYILNYDRLFRTIGEIRFDDRERYLVKKESRKFQIHERYSLWMQEINLSKFILENPAHPLPEYKPNKRPKLEFPWEKL